MVLDTALDPKRIMERIPTVASASLARGHFEVMRAEGEGVRVSGWILNATLPTDVVRLFRDGRLEAEISPQVREDVGRVLAWIPHARHSGFSFTIAPSGPSDRLAVVAFTREREIGRLRTRLRTDLHELPLPPPALRTRVVGGPDPELFKADGLRSYAEFSEAIDRFRPDQVVDQLLDWGCGCGRITTHVIEDRLARRVFGCDIDGEAVAWCQRELPAGEFARIRPEPPTRYSSGQFDVIIGYSVLTHLEHARQESWCRELRRILASDGLLLVSVYGRFAASFAFPDAPRSLLDHGFFDAGEDRALAGIAPPGYYRGVFQTPEFTRRAMSPSFEILDYAEGGTQNYQDLIVARPRAF